VSLATDLQSETSAKAISFPQRKVSQVLVKHALENGTETRALTSTRAIPPGRPLSLQPTPPKRLLSIQTTPPAKTAPTPPPIAVQATVSLQSAKELASSQRKTSQHATKDNSPPRASKSISKKESSSSLAISHTLKSQKSKDLSPASSQISSPRSKPPATSAKVTITYDIIPQQVRLQQLLHLLPLSHTKLSTYERTGDEILSRRYSSLQDRFFENQKFDHATQLLSSLSILRTWSDLHIRTLSTILLDWESLLLDIRAYLKRLNALKPITKSLLEEKGAPLRGPG
jgi:hypothetical protein